MGLNDDLLLVEWWLNGINGDGINSDLEGVSWWFNGTTKYNGLYHLDNIEKHMIEHSIFFKSYSLNILEICIEAQWYTVEAQSFKLLTRKLRGFNRTTNLWAFPKGFNSYTSWDKTWYIEWFHRCTSSDNHEIIYGFDSTQKTIQLSMGASSIHTVPRLEFLGVRTKTVVTLFWNRTSNVPLYTKLSLWNRHYAWFFFAISMTNPKTMYNIYIQYIHLPYIIITVHTNTCSSRKMTGFISSCCFFKTLWYTHGWNHCPLWYCRPTGLLKFFLQSYVHICIT